MSGESRKQALERLCHQHGLFAAYLFGSRADDGLRVLSGETVPGEGSDLDVGVLFPTPRCDARGLARIQLGLDEVFAPLRVDLVPMQHLDSLFQARIIDGHRIFAADSTEVDLHELLIMRRAADLLPFQRAREIELFGISTS